MIVGNLSASSLIPNRNTQVISVPTGTVTHAIIAQHTFIRITNVGEDFTFNFTGGSKGDRCTCFFFSDFSGTKTVTLGSNIKKFDDLTLGSEIIQTVVFIHNGTLWVQMAVYNSLI
jgi:hypothetical protein